MPGAGNSIPVSMGGVAKTQCERRVHGRGGRGHGSSLSQSACVLMKASAQDPGCAPGDGLADEASGEVFCLRGSPQTQALQAQISHQLRG